MISQNVDNLVLLGFSLDGMWKVINLIVLTGADPGYFFRKMCTTKECLLLFFNTNKPLSQNTSCIEKLQVISWGGGVRTPCTLALDPPLVKLQEVRMDTKQAKKWDDFKECRNPCYFGIS